MSINYVQSGYLVGSLALGACVAPHSDQPRSPQEPGPSTTQSAGEPASPADEPSQPVAPTAPAPPPGPAPGGSPDAGSAPPEDLGGYAWTGNPEQPGPYPVASYEPVPPGGTRYTVWYPDTSVAQQFPAVIVAPGATYLKEDMAWLGEHLASHGYLAVGFTPTIQVCPCVGLWRDGLMDSVAQLKREADDSRSPIHARWEKGNIGAVGYSAGGGGALLASSESAELRTVVGLAPAVNILDAPGSTDVPFLQICGGTDDVVPREACATFHDNHAGTEVPRQLLLLRGVGHWVFVNGAEPPNALQAQATSRRYVVAWLHRFLKGLTDEANELLIGAGAERDLASGELGDLRHDSM